MTFNKSLHLSTFASLFPFVCIIYLDRKPTLWSTDSLSFGETQYKLFYQALAGMSFV